MTLKPLIKPDAQQSLSHKLFRAEQVRNNEEAAAQASDLDMYTLMQRAGYAAFQTLLEHWPDAEDVVIVCGTGNNGGDGYVVGQLCLETNLNITLVSIDPSRQLSGDAHRARQAFEQAEGTVLDIRALDNVKPDVVVDALLGTGLQGSVKDPYVEMIDRINALNCPVLAIDIASGLHADTGTPLGAAVRASRTVTFVGIKSGLVTGSGKAHSGHVHLDDLGIADAFSQRAKTMGQWLHIDDFDSLPVRATDSHKSHHGRLLCVGGNNNMSGAIRLTGEAAMRCGAGMVKVFCHQDSKLAVATGRPEMMIDHDNLNTHLEWATCVVLGPGLGRNDWGKNTFEHVINYLCDNPLPVLIDADGLYWLGKLSPALPSDVSLIITPHAAEAARLLDCRVEEVEQDRYRAAEMLSQKYNAVALLKGAGTVIQCNQHRYVCRGGNPGMATAGMGDVLSGVIAGLLAQGMDTEDATPFGACLHAGTGDFVAEKYGQRGILASDVINQLRILINK